MHPSEFFDELKKRNGFTSDTEVARRIGLTSARISQMRTRSGNLTARQLASYIKKAVDRGRELALTDPILPIVEMYPIDAVSSTQGAKWEMLPTGEEHPKNQTIRSILEESQGIYLFYDSQGRAIYVGKTEKQNIWKEMNDAFNRELSNHQVFFVEHPTNGTTFWPACERPRQPKKMVVYLYDTALYFSAYKVTESRLIPKLEALVVRAFCNSLSNKKMEKF